MSAGVTVPGNAVLMLFFSLFLKAPNQLKAGCGAATRTFNHAPKFLLLHSVGGCQSFVWIYAEKLQRSDSETSHQTDSKYTRLQTGVAKWRLVGKRHMDINLCINDNITE